MMKSETHPKLFLLALLIGVRAVIFGIVLAHANPTNVWQFTDVVGLIFLIVAVPVFILLSREKL